MVLVTIEMTLIQMKLTRNRTQHTHTGTRSSGGKRLSKINTLILFKSPCHKPRLGLDNPSLFVSPSTEQSYGVTMQQSLVKT